MGRVGGRHEGRGDREGAIYRETGREREMEGGKEWHIKREIDKEGEGLV